MKAQYVKMAICHHCNMEFQIARSDHKFCSTSHRAANYSLKKRLANKLALLETSSAHNAKSAIEEEVKPAKPINGVNQVIVPEQILEGQDPYQPNFLKDLMAAAIPTLLNESIKSLKQINNSQIMELLSKNQDTLLEINDKVNALKEELHLKVSAPDSDTHTPISVNLLN